MDNEVFDIVDNRWNHEDRTSDDQRIQGVTGGTDQTSGECSLGQTVPI